MLEGPDGGKAGRATAVGSETLESLQPEAAAIRAQVEKILASKPFLNAERLKRFLRFIVDQTLQGQADRLKEYLIATEVFDRKDTFDPRLHSIVRVEATNLRSKLKEYYENEGATEPVLIDLAKGRYAVAFRLRKPSSCAAATPSAEIAAPASRQGVEPAAKRVLRYAALLARWARSRKALVVFALLAGLAAILAHFWPTRFSRPAHLGEAVRSIAVIPFKPLAAEAGDVYLEFGMADALITRLSNLQQITVRPTAAVLKYTGPGHDPLAAGQALKVDAVLDGKVQRSGDRIRVTVQLVRVRDGAPLWAETFDEKFTHIFAVQDSISRQVVQALMLKLTGEEPIRLAKHYTKNTEAYELYLKGRYHLETKGSPEGWKKSVEYFQQAIEKDPGYALAYAGLADSYSMGHFWGAPPAAQKEAVSKARGAARKALQMDAQLAEAHISLGQIHFRYDWNWRDAEREFQRALDLNPNHPLAHQHYGAYLTAMGRHDEAIAELKRAQELDPLSLTVNATSAWIFVQARRYDQGIEQYRKTIELDPNFAAAHQYLAGTYESKGMWDEAIAEHIKARSLQGHSAETLAVFRATYQASGIRGIWRKELALALEQARRQYDPSDRIPKYYTMLGEKDAAFEWLEKAYADRLPVAG